MSRTRYDISPWYDRVPARGRPVHRPFRGSQQTDVAVVGAGLSGVLTAYLLARSGLRVAVLEAERVGHLSARAAGFVFELPPVSFTALRERHGLKAARHMFARSRKAGLDFAALLRRLRIRGDLAVGSGWRLATSADGARRLRRDLEAQKAAGLDGAWTPASRVVRTARVAAEGAVRYQRDGWLDPYRVTLGLARAAEMAGATFFERSRVDRTRFSRAGAELSVNKGTLRAGRVVLATGAPGRLFPALRRHFDEFERYVVLTDPVPAATGRRVGRSLGRDDETPPHTWCQLADGRIVCQGADQRRPPDRARMKVLVQRTGQLMYELSRVYPDISGIPAAYGWACQGSAAADGLLVAGPHRAFPHHVFVYGLGHHSVSDAYLAARIATRHLLGVSEKADEVFGFMR
jgi:glycine/D-amino acid oxidase-like deaminating enzyme